ncbi:exonuclease subunit SbcC, partial [Treponema pallidum]
MKPMRLTLHNIGPFVGTHTVDFTALGPIFLVCGKTGSGKTTLFDAIAYALYGKPLGTRAEVIRSLRSHYAAPSEAAFATLEFSLGTKIYRVHRTLTCTLSHRKTEQPEQLYLEQKKGHGWERIACAHKSETECVIHDLLKLNSKEFERVVMLPQGECAQFLKANSKEKKETLMNLFPVDQYTALMERAKKKSLHAKAVLETLRSQLETLCAECMPDTYHERKQTLEAELQHARDALQQTRISHAYYTQKREALEAQLKKQQLCKELRARIETYRAQEPVHAETQKRIDRARKAAPLAAHIKHVTQCEQDAQRIHAEIQEKMRSREQLLMKRAAHVAQQSSIEEQRRLLQTLHSACIHIEDAHDVATSIRDISCQAHTLTQHIHTLAQQKTTLTQQEQSLCKELDILQREAGTIDTRTSAFNDLQIQLAHAKKTQELSQRYAELCAAHATCTAQCEKLEKIHAQKSAYSTRAREQLLQTKEQIHLQETRTHAVVLARLLEHQEPCPVCGSCIHPNPARQDIDNLEPLTRRMQRIEQTYAQLETSEKDVYHILTSERERRASYSAQMQEIQHSFSILTSCDTRSSCDIPNVQKITVRVLDLTEKLSRAKDMLACAQHALLRKKQPEQDLQDVRAHLQQCSQELAKKETALHALQETLTQQRVRIHALSIRLPKELLASNLLAPQKMQHEKESVAYWKEMLAHCQTLMRELHTHIEEYDREFNEIENASSALGADIAAREDALNHVQKEYMHLARTVCCARTEAHFNNNEEVTAALMTDAELSHAAAEIQFFNELRAADTHLLKTLEAEIGTEIPSDLDELNAQCHTLVKDEENFLSRIEILSATLHTLT